MRNDSAAFADANAAPVAYPRLSSEQAFTMAGDNSAWMTSHDDAAVPAGAVVLSGVVESVSATSQRLELDKARSGIGNVDLRLTDVAYAVTSLLNQHAEGSDSLKGRDNKSYLGFAGLAFEDYSQVHAQIVTGLVKEGDSYVIECADRQRELRKDIFSELIELTLTQTLPDDSTDLNYNTLHVVDTTGLSGVLHGVTYGDAAGLRVVYLERRSGDSREVLRFLESDIQPTQINNVLRGALNTQVLEHVVDLSAGEDARAKFKEYPYIEASPIEISYMLQTGFQLLQPAETVPDGWHLGVDPSHVVVDEYMNIGSDIFDTVDPLDSFILSFDGTVLKKQDGKKFIEEQLWYPSGVFAPVYSDGRTGLRRLANIQIDALYDVVFDNDNVISNTEIRKNYDRILNLVHVFWDWNPHTLEFSRDKLLGDLESISRYESSKVREIKLYGVNGSRHTLKTLAQIVNRLNDAFAYETYDMSVSVLPEMSAVEPGDIVRYRDDQELDPVTNLPIDRSFMVISKNEDPVMGDLSYRLMGSSAPAGSLLSVTNAAVIADADYDSKGKGDPLRDIELLAGAAIQNVNGVLHLVSDFTFNGGDSCNDPASWLYIGADFVIKEGVTFTLTKNWTVWHPFHCTNNGVITTAGQGLAGGLGSTGFINTRPYYGNATPGQLGFWGSSMSQMGIVWEVREWHYVSSVFTWDVQSLGSWPRGGTFFPPLALEYRDGMIHGIPDVLCGSSSSGGGPALSASNGVITFRAAGGDGVPSGGGGAWVGRGMSIGVSGEVRTDGVDGILGGSYTHANGRVIRGGASAGSYPGVFLYIPDGKGSVLPDFVGKFSAKVGGLPLVGEALAGQDNGGKAYRVDSGAIPMSPWNNRGYDSLSYVMDLSTSAVRTLFVPNPVDVAPLAEIAYVQPPASISAPSTGTAQLLTAVDGTQSARAWCEVVASPDPLLDYYQWEYRVDGAPWVSRSSYVDKKTLGIHADGVVEGQSIEFRCRAISVHRNKSEWVVSVSAVVLGKQELPGDLVGVSVGSVMGQYTVKITPNAVDNDIAHYEVWEALSNNRALMSDSYKKSSVDFDRDLVFGTGKFIWVRPVDSSGNQGNWFPGSATAGLAVSSMAVDYASDVVGVPASLGDINSGEAGHLASIEAGADVTRTAGNLVQNSEFLSDSSHWMTSGSTPNTAFGRNLSSDWNLDGGITAYVVQADGLEYPGTHIDLIAQSDVATRTTPVEAGKYYQASAYTGAHRCNVRLFLAWYDSTNVHISFSDGDGNYSEKMGGKYLDGYKRLFALAQAPVGAVKAILFLRKYPTTQGIGATNSYMFVTRVHFGEGSENMTAPSPWVSGDIPQKQTALNTQNVGGSSAALVESNAANGSTFTSSDAGLLAYADQADWDGDIANRPLEESLLNVNDAVALGFNPTFDWIDGELRPRNWGAWNGNPTHEKTIVRIGKSAPRFITDGLANAGMVRVYTFASPMPADTVFKGSYDYRITSDDPAFGTCGFLIEVGYGGAGAYTRHHVTVDDRTPDGLWRTRQFAVRAAQGQTVDFFRVYVMGSWTLFAGGYSKINVTFDRFQFEMIQKEFDNTQQQWTEVQARPTTLSALNSADGAHLAGIEVGATNTTNTSQLVDGAQLGLTSLWSGVVGAGRPADNADVTVDNVDARGSNIAPPRYSDFSASDTPPTWSGLAALPVSVGIDPVIGFYGSSSLKIVTNAASYTSVFLATNLSGYDGGFVPEWNINVDPLSVYIVALRVRCSGASAFMRVSLSPDVGASVVLDGVTSATANEWSLLSFEVTLSDLTATQAVLSFFLASGLTYWVDAIQITEKIGNLGVIPAYVPPSTVDAYMLQNTPRVISVLASGVIQDGPSTVVVAKVATGTYRLTHGAGSTDHGIVVSTGGAAERGYYATETINYFDYYTKDGAGVLVDAPATIILGAGYF